MYSVGMREATLGEEIISLATKGVNAPTVERMYRKYLYLISEENEPQKSIENTKMTVIDGEFQKAYDTLERLPNSFNESPMQIGDKIAIELRKIGIFTATAHKIVDNKILFIFDSCVAKHSMNNVSTNKGGYENSDLKKWIDNTLFNSFPDCLKDRMSGLSIPSVGEIFGWDDDYVRHTFKYDHDKQQLPLMKDKQYRIAKYKGETEWYWLKNRLFNNSYQFAYANILGYASYYNASNHYVGVRPEFWFSI